MSPERVNYGGSNAPLLLTEGQTTWIWRFLKQRTSRQQCPRGIYQRSLTDGEREGTYFSRVDRQRGEVDVEYATVVGHLPREITVLRKS